MTPRHTLVPAVLLALAACSSGGSDPCDPVGQAGCEAGLVCEQVSGAQPACFDPVVISGTVRVLGASTATPVAGARVVTLDQDRAPLSSVATSDAGGGWSLRVPAPRDPSGRPIQAAVTLRADAQGYQTFPGGLRTALPLELSSAVHDAANHRWISAR